MIAYDRSIKHNRIAISGGLCSGKTTAATYLTLMHQFKLLGFAAPMYELERIHKGTEWGGRVYEVRRWVTKNVGVLGIYQEIQLKDLVRMIVDTMNEVPVQKGKNRTFLQRIGTETGRKFDEDLWVRIWQYRLLCLGPDARTVNDNLRFPNEIEATTGLGFVKIWLDITEETLIRRYTNLYGVAPDLSQLSHASEAHHALARGNADHIFDNNSDNPSGLFAFLEDTVLRDRKTLAQAMA